MTTVRESWGEGGVGQMGVPVVFQLGQTEPVVRPVNSGLIYK